MTDKREKYSEILLLERLLQEEGIEHNKYDALDGFQITIPLPGGIEPIASIIDHNFSYGSVMNLLEIWDGQGVQGFLTAGQVLERIKRSIKGRESPGANGS